MYYRHKDENIINYEMGLFCQMCLNHEPMYDVKQNIISLSKYIALLYKNIVFLWFLIINTMCRDFLEGRH